MFSICDHGTRLCDGRGGLLSRREWLRVGGLGAVGLGLPGLLQAREAGGRSTPSPGGGFGRAKACIVLFFLGGPPQHETWDPKPDAPAEVRGPFAAIPTALPGLRVGELMPLTARVADHLCVLRAMATDDNAHSSSGYWMLTGVPHQPMNVENALPGAPNDWPCVGAVVRHLRPPRGALPAAVTVPEDIWNCGRLPWPGQTAGWLGRAADPWLLHCDPAAPDFQVPGVTLPADLPPLRVDARRSLLDQVNQHLDRADPLAARFAGLHRQAFDVLRAPAARRAFDLDREPPTVRDRYGRHRFGQSVLLARRLIEAGVSLVQVNWTRQKGAPNEGMWDTHAKNAESLKTVLMPAMDQAYSALIEDLEQRGLLDETLVVWQGEFGRTPRHNPAAGRDHWGHVFSVALAGGGVRPGQVLGASDRLAAYPKDGRATPADLTATLFHLLGLDPATELHDPLGRPVPLSRGTVVRGVVG